MDRIQVSQDILPLGEFKARASHVLRSMRDGGRTFVITRNGRPAAVLLTPEEYDRLTQRDRFVRAVEAGLADSRAGRSLTDEDLSRELGLRDR